MNHPDLVQTILVKSRPVKPTSPIGSLWQQRSARWLLALGLVCLSSCAASDAQSVAEGQGDRRPVPVVATTVKRQTVPLLVQATGTVQAYATVSVQSQASGLLTGVYFREGQTVNKGDLLFTIDARPLQAALDQAVANRAKAAAQLTQAKADLAQAEAKVAQAQATVTKDLAETDNAEAQAQRYTDLRSQGVISQNEADQYRTTAEAQRAIVAASQSDVGSAMAAVESARANVQNAQAAVTAAEAEVDTARVQLSYASIYAPLSGRLGTLNVDQGNLVKDNDTNPLVVISQVQPIYVQFSIPQQWLPDLKKYQAAGKLRVVASASQNGAALGTGELVFVDSGVDATTGTIKLKSRFANADDRLTPGEFVNVELRLTQQPDAIVVPTSAVQSGQNGPFVYLIKPDETVEARTVTMGQAVNNQTVIKTGLAAGDRIVVDGQFNLAPGATVKEQEQPAENTKPGQSDGHQQGQGG